MNPEPVYSDPMFTDPAYVTCRRCGGTYSQARYPNCPHEHKPPFDPTKPVETTDGRKAEILLTDFNGQIVARVFDTPEQSLRLFHQDGTSVSLRVGLVNVPAMHTRMVWINHYADGMDSTLHTSRAMADLCAKDYRIGCTCFNDIFPEGYGL